MKDPIHITCASNAGYIMPMTVMLSSLIDHFATDRELYIHILNSDATPQQRDDVEESVRLARPDSKLIHVKWYKVELPAFSCVKQTRRHTLDVFSRYYAPYLIPETVERALYLDGDIILQADVSELFDSTAGSPALLHAIQSLTIPWVSCPEGVFDYKELGIPAKAPYFNSGVMLMNLRQWRERDITNKLSEYVLRNGPDINEADQGALNALLWNEWVPLDQHWNAHSSLNVPENRLQTGLSEEEWEHLRLHPKLIHYTADKKPWMKGVVFPRYSYFYHYLQKTVYKDTIPHRPRLEDYLGVRLYYHLWNFLRKLPRPRRAAPAPAAAPA
jgi:lipopolysaccharide biosynthesis glycosyltransferase